MLMWMENGLIVNNYFFIFSPFNFFKCIIFLLEKIENLMICDTIHNTILILKTVDMIYVNNQLEIVDMLFSFKINT